MYRSLCDLARRLLRDHPNFRRSLCATHGGLCPHYVLVERNRIYVIDLASSRIGKQSEDLASFTAYLDIFPPWRRALAALRVPLAEQRRLPLDSYGAQARRCASRRI